eukprot:TRINITY_DN6873_c0_g2_i1.p1 TRINITY_DN6873_c0_g2~~TRINITY_DN6873_c0_g2_i1.p1  ORF type:complete len:820 (-),score=209.29 TRINITY_DN6873_c0_g2_i1:97-2556(-)
MALAGRASELFQELDADGRFEQLLCLLAREHATVCDRYEREIMAYKIKLYGEQAVRPKKNDEEPMTEEDRRILMRGKMHSSLLHHSGSQLGNGNAVEQEKNEVKDVAEDCDVPQDEQSAMRPVRPRLLSVAVTQACTVERTSPTLAQKDGDSKPAEADDDAPPLEGNAVEATEDSLSQAKKSVEASEVVARIVDRLEDGRSEVSFISTPCDDQNGAAMKTEESTKAGSEQVVTVWSPSAELQKLRPYQHTASSTAFRLKRVWDKDIGPDCGLTETEMMAGNGASLAPRLTARRRHGVQRGMLSRRAQWGKISKAWEDAGSGFFVIPPNGSFRVTWDIMGMVLIGYDCLMIPFNLAFQPPITMPIQVIDALLLYFWTLDMMQAFFLAFYDKGILVTSHRRIVCNYMRTWFIVDLVVVGPEWISILAGSGDDVFGGLGRMLKGFRAIRVLRLLRLLKLQRIVNMLYDLLESEYTFIVVNLVKLLGSVSVLNHMIACIWYLIGRLCWEADLRNWIVVGDIDKADLAYKYTTALHWSLTQFTPASMDISARNVYERIFSIVVLFFAMVAFSSIVASITGAMTSLRNLKNDQDKQFWLLRRYLRQKNVKQELCSRITKFLEYQLEHESTSVQSSSIKIIKGLSQELERELAHQMHGPDIVHHPFFGILEHSMSGMVQRLCHKALKLQTFAAKEMLFSAGEEASYLYFVKAGSLSYKFGGGIELDPPPEPKDWLSEPVLWVEWRHRGDMQAMSESHMVTISPGIFSEVMFLHPKPWTYAKQYAIRFLEMLNGIERADLLDCLRQEFFYEETTIEAWHCEIGADNI